MAATKAEPVERHSVHTLVFRHLKRTHEMFQTDEDNLCEHDEKARKLFLDVKVRSEYAAVVRATKESKRRRDEAKLALPAPPLPAMVNPSTGAVTPGRQPLALTAGDQIGSASTSSKLAVAAIPAAAKPGPGGVNDNVKALLPKRAPIMAKPDWHAPWKLYRVISGHTGWVRCIDVEPGNEWFATGAGDRIIKIWDLASGKLKLSLTGHVSPVRGIKISQRQPYLFSVGEDKMVKCWDLEYNKVIRHYHGHLSAVYSVDLHPTIDILCTSGRDATTRVG